MFKIFKGTFRETSLFLVSLLSVACASVTITATPTVLPPPRAVTVIPIATPPRALTATPESGPSSFTLLLTNSFARQVTYFDSVKGISTQVEVGAAPWRIALTKDQTRAYISTAEGVAVLDVVARKRLALIPYQTKIPTQSFGEYREGGMGLALSPDEQRLYVAIYLVNGASVVEVLDTVKQIFVATIKVGIRPFDLVASRDGKFVYSLDHDSFTVTVIETQTLTTRVVPVTPIGGAAFNKPHYAVLGDDGLLWMPFQGKALIALNPVTGKFTALPLTANTHQHGLTMVGPQIFIVGNGAAGEATSNPSLTIYDLEKKTEKILPLTRPHEQVALSPDGRYAYLTGGYPLAGGWDGLTVLDLEQNKSSEVFVPDKPFDLVVLK